MPRLILAAVLLTACYETTPDPTATDLADGICHDPELHAGWIYDDDARAYVLDMDQDGIGTPADCDDADDQVGTRTWLWHDYDRDGYGGDAVYVCAHYYDVDAGGVMVTTGGDCDDADPRTYPHAPEVCDRLDNDCDGLADDYDAHDLDSDDALLWYLDLDGDGYGRPYSEVLRCDQPAGYSPVDTDCDDDDRRRHPGAPGRWACPA